MTVRSLRRLASLLVAVGLVALLASRTMPVTGPSAGLPAGHVTSPAGSASGKVTLAPGGGAHQSTEGACDLDGVHVGYRTAYRSTLPLGYDLTHAVVSQIAWPSCNGAVLSVVLGDADAPDLATGEVTLTSAIVALAGSSATVAVPVSLVEAPDSLPDAAPIVSVGISLAGGTTPIPPECAGMQFSSSFIGTTGDDVIEGTNPKGDLIYSLSGADRIDGRQGRDCIITGADSDGDVVVVGNGANVVLTGAGNDTVIAGNGASRIFTGAGDDTITVGNGSKGAHIDAGPGFDTCRIPKSVKQITVVGCERRVTT